MLQTMPAAAIARSTPMRKIVPSPGRPLTLTTIAPGRLGGFGGAVGRAVVDDDHLDVMDAGDVARMPLTTCASSSSLSRGDGYDELHARLGVTGMERGC